MRRMVNTKILDLDMFLDMPATTRLLYYDLLARADDDGFITPKRVMRMTGASDNDLGVLKLKNFVHAWDDGVIVLLHWREHNHVKSDRYSPSDFYPRLKELKGIYALGAREDGSKLVTKRIHSGSKVVPQDRLGEGSVGEGSKTIKTTVIENEEVDQMRSLWKQHVQTTLRNHLAENMKAYKFLKGELGADLPQYLQAVRLIRADKYQKRALQGKLINFIGLKERLEEVEAYMQSRVDEKVTTSIKVYP